MPFSPPGFSNPGSERLDKTCRGVAPLGAGDALIPQRACWDPTLSCLPSRAAPLQITYALAMAYILNRTLVFPEMMCYCDRYW